MSRMDTLLAKRGDFVAFVERRVGERALAEDILQDAFARGAESLGSVRADESVVAWFYRLLRNAVVDHQRRQRVRREALDRFAHEVDREQPPPDVRQAVCRCVMRIAQDLGAEQSKILQQIEVDEVPVKDYAAAVGITANAANVRIFRAREALRRAVTSSCGSCAKDGCAECDC